MKNNKLKYLFLAIAVAATIVAFLPEKRKVTHMVSSNPAERRR